MAGDEYDALNHRVLVADCANQTLVGVDATTGARSVVVDTWPWPEFGSTSCVEELVVDPYNATAFATVSRTYPDPDDPELYCVSSDLVSIDTWGGKVQPMANIRTVCCDDCGDGHEFYSPQVDHFNWRLLMLEADCSPDACDYAISARPLDGTDPYRVQGLYPVACYPDDEGCDYSYVAPNVLTFDPQDPDHRVLVVATPSTTFETRIDSIDLDTGAIVETISIRTDWSDFQVNYIADISVDTWNGGMYLTVAGTRPGGEVVWGVIAMDRTVPSDPTLLYDGSPTADGRALSCTPIASFDSLLGRILLVEPPGGYGCQGNVFALDLWDGSFSGL